MPLIKHRYQSVRSGEKSDVFVRLLDGENVDRALIYTNLRPTAEEVAELLQSLGYHAAVRPRWQ